MIRVVDRRRKTGPVGIHRPTIHYSIHSRSSGYHGLSRLGIGQDCQSPQYTREPLSIIFAVIDILLGIFLLLQVKEIYPLVRLRASSA